MGRSLAPSSPQPGLALGLWSLRRAPGAHPRAWPWPRSQQSERDTRHNKYRVPSAGSGPCTLPWPLGRQYPSKSPCYGRRVTGVGQWAHLPHEVLDTAQLALNAGSVQQGLPDVVAPVPLWAQSPHGDVGVRGWGGTGGQGRVTHALSRCAHLAPPPPAQAALKLLLLQPLGPVNFILWNRARPTSPGEPSPCPGSAAPRRLLCGAASPTPDLCRLLPGKHLCWATSGPG